MQTRIVGVESMDKVVAVAQQWADDGVQLIELCGWFGEEGESRLVKAVGDKVTIGYVIDSPKTEHLMKKIFSE